ncbi:hypothetical protein J437_LFUL015268 [Ladona fulva]|uniref:Uncharacterized protein n=1 Tax=Ladona fulva TaxID=123851 RepID=A0A8K0KS04_LADFU|nr:hypothetical protein J437_LFUL015268 [Ladona fulva]
MRFVIAQRERLAVTPLEKYKWLYSVIMASTGGHTSLNFGPTLTRSTTTNVSRKGHVVIPNNQHNAVEKTCDFFVGMTVLRGISLVITPPTVSIPIVNGFTSRRTIASVSCSPERTPACKSYWYKHIGSNRAYMHEENWMLTCTAAP